MCAAAETGRRLARGLGVAQPAEGLSADVGAEYLPGPPVGGEYKGAAGVEEFFTTLNEPAEITKFEVHTLIAEGDYVVALGYSATTVKATGNTGEGPFVHVFRFAGDKVSTFDEYEHVEPGLWG